MAYTRLCLTTDLDAFYQGVVLSASTKPSKDVVEGWIDQATALIYSAVAQEYVVPVTDATDLLILKNLCVEYVRDEVNFVLGKNRVNISVNQALVPRGISHSGFQKKLDQIRDGSFRLLNTAAASTVNSYSYTAANDITAEATKETAQW